MIRFCLFGFLVLLTFFVSYSSSVQVQNECRPGETTKQDCNNCFCLPRGIWSCTRMECWNKRSVIEVPKPYYCDDFDDRGDCKWLNNIVDSTRYIRPVEDQFLIRSKRSAVSDVACSDGQRTSFDGCNTCICSNGIWACTLMLCLDQNQLRSKRSVQNECRPGETTKQDCNDCFCLPSGIWSCTKMKCLNKRSVSDVACSDGQRTSFDGCNTCICSNGIWACTLMLCLDQNQLRSKRSVQNECRPGETTKQDCNNCFCLPSGIWSCTKMKCLNKRSVSDVACSDGQRTSFDGGCNTCICSNGIWACTQMLCLDQNQLRSKRSVQNECRPGETTKQDCNDCFCLPSGIWSCTKMKCLNKRSVSDVVCLDGQITSFDGCNTCTCSNRIWACTEMFCLDQNQFPLRSKRSVQNECLPGETTKQDCNNCFCVPPGIWSCTKIECSS